MKSMKIKATVPVDKTSRVKKVKHIVLDTASKKRKAPVGNELSSKKKTKKHNHISLENEQPTGTDSMKPPHGKPSAQINISGNKRASRSYKAGVTTRQSLIELEVSRPLKDNEVRRDSFNEAQSGERIPFHDDKNRFSDGFEDEEVDDQTAALLKGFESDEEAEKDPEDKGYVAGQEIPSVDKKAKEQAKAAGKALASDLPGVIYIGRIPHGFYEQEMRQYFSQFGDISKLRLSRNRRTGKSKHYAFLEFKSAEVAEIVSKTMDSYLLFGHILKCKMVAPEQVHENLWAGANRRFKKVPWNKMEGRKLKQGLTKAVWTKRIEREEIRRTEKQAAMKMIGYSFLNPDLSSAKEVTEASRQRLITTERLYKEKLQETEPANVMEKMAEAHRGG